MKELGIDAFNGCRNITSVVIPDSITKINHSAFAFCENLQNFTIPDTVTEIGMSAFGWCPTLTEMTVPNSVHTLGENAFIQCINLKKVTLSNQLTSIENQTFEECYNLKEVVLQNGITTIAEKAFYQCYSLRSITLPETLTSIGEEAFFNAGLESVFIPNKVVSIGKKAFNNCDDLLSVTLGEKVKNIGQYAFSNAKLVELHNYSSLPIVSTVGSEDIEEYDKFGRIGYHLKDIYTSAVPSRIFKEGDFSYYQDENDHYWLMTYTGNATELTLPDSVKQSTYSVYPYAFDTNADITKLVISSGVIHIGERAFSLPNVQSVTVGANVKEIEDFAFGWCPKLVEVVNKSRFNIRSTANSENPDERNQFGGLGLYLRQVIQDEADTRIVKLGDFTFYNDPDGLYLIGYSGNEKDVVLPESVNGAPYKIYPYAFSQGFYYRENHFNHYPFNTITVPECVRYIGEYAFERACNKVILKNPNGWKADGTPVSKEEIELEYNRTSPANHYTCVWTRD